VLRALRFGGRHAWAVLAALVLAIVLSARLLNAAAEARWARDVSRMVFNDNLELLRALRAGAGAATDSLRQVLSATPETPAGRPYLVVSVADRRLWYKHGDSVLFSTQVATGSGRTLVKEGGTGGHWKFETPRGRLVVLSKDSMPAWVPPDWHFVEQARKRGLGLVRLTRGQALQAADGSAVEVQGTDVVRRWPTDARPRWRPPTGARSSSAATSSCPLSAPTSAGTPRCWAPGASTWVMATRCTAPTGRRRSARRSATGASASGTRTWSGCTTTSRSARPSTSTDGARR
jgi:hypothetical protein